MKKRLPALLLAAAMLLSLPGCASIFDKEYLSVTDYADSTSDVNSEGATEVGNYLSLRLAITNLVTEHAESGTVDFRNYSGDISDDIAAACKAVSTGTPLGSYCVDYISYDLDRIVAYYEATVYISYKRTAEEVAGIISVSTTAGVRSAVADALRSMDGQVVVMVSASGLDESGVEQFVTDAYMDEPLSCVNRPSASVTSYSGSGLQKIYEINIDYGGDTAKLTRERKSISDAVDELAGSIKASGAGAALQAANAITGRCRSDSDGGNTVKAAILEGSADSEGMALAYKALCSAAGVECVVVEGRFDKQEHYWNIIGIDGDYYHVDVSRAADAGISSVFLRSDKDIWGAYWWDYEDYPTCEGSLTYGAVAASA